MKKVLFFSALLFLLTLIPKASAEIKEGKSSVNTSVTTNVNSSSNTSNNTSQTTHIEIEVNGEKKVLDTQEPGTHVLSIENEGGKSSATVKIGNDADSSDTSEKENEDETGDSLDEDEDENEDEKEESENKTIIQRIVEQVKDFFENLFSIF